MYGWILEELMIYLFKEEETITTTTDENNPNREGLIGWIRTPDDGGDEADNDDLIKSYVVGGVHLLTSSCTQKIHH